MPTKIVNIDFSYNSKRSYQNCTMGRTCLWICLNKETYSDHNYNTKVTKNFRTSANENAFTYPARLYDKKGQSFFVLRSEFDKIGWRKIQLIYFWTKYEQFSFHRLLALASFFFLQIFFFFMCVCCGCIFLVLYVGYLSDSSLCPYLSKN